MTTKLNGMQTTVVAQISNYGSTHGYSQSQIDIAIKTAFIESSLGAKPGPNHLGATGLFQYRPGTWETTSPSGDINSFQDQIEAFYGDITKYTNRYNGLTQEQRDNINISEYIYLKHNGGASAWPPKKYQEVIDLWNKTNPGIDIPCDGTTDQLWSDGEWEFSSYQNIISWKNTTTGEKIYVFKADTSDGVRKAGDVVYITPLDNGGKAITTTNKNGFSITEIKNKEGEITERYSDIDDPLDVTDPGHDGEGLWSGGLSDFTTADFDSIDATTGIPKCTDTRTYSDNTGDGYFDQITSQYGSGSISSLLTPSYGTVSTDSLSSTLDQLRQSLAENENLLLETQAIRSRNGGQCTANDYGGNALLEISDGEIAALWNSTQLNSTSLTLDSFLVDNANILSAPIVDGSSIEPATPLIDFPEFFLSDLGDTPDTVDANTGTATGPNGGRADIYEEIYGGFSFSPVVLDLDGDGVELVSRENSHAYYDVSGDGMRHNIGWIGSDDAFLVYDKGKDGVISQPDELSFSLLSGKANATDLEALATFDTNGNGRIDKGDSQFGQLRIWQDKNGDGVSDFGEVTTLSKVGITSINLSIAPVNWAEGGNHVTGFATYSKTDGSVSIAADVSLNYEVDGWAASTSGDFVTVSQSGGLSFGLNVNGDINLSALNLDGVQGGRSNDTLSASASSTGVFIDGGNGNDSILGGNGNDWLVGGNGKDTVKGGKGDDVLLFGEKDSIDGGDGFDIAIVSDDHATTLNLSTLHLEAAMGGDGADSFSTSGAGQVILLGNGGNDSLYGGAGSDVISGGSGNDKLSGSTGNDVYVFQRGDGIDTITDEEFVEKTTVTTSTSFSFTIGLNGQITTQTTFSTSVVYTTEQVYAGYDLLSMGNGITTADLDVTQSGNNLLIGIRQAGEEYTAISALSDRVTVSNGTNALSRIEAVAFANGQIESTSEWIVGNSGNNSLKGNDANNHLFGDAGDDILMGGDGSDTLTGSQGNDTLHGDAGNDFLIGGTGNDELHGNDNNDLLHGGSGADTLCGESGNDTLQGDSGGDVLYGGIGFDLLKGGDGSDLIFGGIGNDTLFGQDGQDTLYGGEGDDSIEGNQNNDTLYGAQGDDTLRGGDGNDDLAGEDDNDSLIGGIGNDILRGNSGNDTLSGQHGLDTLFGGMGDDLYRFQYGDGRDTLYEVAFDASGNQINSGQDTLAFGDTITVDNLSAEQLSSDLVIGVDENQDTAPSVTTQTDQITIQGWANPDSQVETATFSDESSENIQAWIVGDAGDNPLSGNAANNRMFGGRGHDSLSGMAGNDTLNGGVGNDTLRGGDGNDDLHGNRGQDSLLGGMGDDRYWLDHVDDFISESANAGIDSVFSSVDYTLADNLEKLTLVGEGQVNATGNAQGNHLDGNAANNRLEGLAGGDTIRGGLGNDSLFGGTGNDFLYGGKGNDFLSGGSGSDVLNGGAGNDTYSLSRGDGAERIKDEDSTLGNADVLAFGSGISLDQLWFARSGENLEISVIGSSNRAIIESWYTGDDFRVERFQTADGHALASAQVDALVQAMAAFSPPAMGQSSLPANYQQSLQPVFAANWQ